MNIITAKSELLEAFTSRWEHHVLYRHRGIVLRVDVIHSYLDSMNRHPRIQAVAALSDLAEGLRIHYTLGESGPLPTKLEQFTSRDTEYYLGPGAVASGQITLGEIPSTYQGLIKQTLEAFSKISTARAWGHEELLTKIRDLKSTQYM